MARQQKHGPSSIGTSQAATAAAKWQWEKQQGHQPSLVWWWRIWMTPAGCTRLQLDRSCCQGSKLNMVLAVQGAAAEGELRCVKQQKQQQW
jgi:hypothetical protein